MEHSVSPERMREYSGDTLRDVAIVFTVLETIAVGLRFASLRASERKFGIDDFLTIPALVCCLGVNAAAFVGIKYGGFGYHHDAVESTNPAAIVVWGKLLVAIPIIYTAACAFPRVILLTMYLRLFGIYPLYRVASYVLMGLVVSLAVADIVAGAVECIPIAHLWDSNITNASCINLAIFFRWGTLPNAIIDLFMLFLPQPVIWKIQASVQVRIGLAATFLTGSVGIITSICRTIAFFQNDPLSDGTWKQVTYLSWSIVEPSVYLIAACLPCYRSLLRLPWKWVLRDRADPRSASASRGLSLDLSDKQALRPSGGWTQMPESGRSKPRVVQNNIELGTWDHNRTTGG